MKQQQDKGVIPPGIFAFRDKTMDRYHVKEVDESYDKWAKLRFGLYEVYSIEVDGVIWSVGDKLKEGDIIIYFEWNDGAWYAAFDTGYYLPVRTLTCVPQSHTPVVKDEVEKSKSILDKMTEKRHAYEAKLKAKYNDDYFRGFNDAKKHFDQTTPIPVRFPTEAVTRIEVIEAGKGRYYTNYRVSDVELSLQDDNRTLKIFIKSLNNTTEDI